MSFMNIAQQRYSVRGYEEKEVEREKIVQVLEAGRIAPSAVNFQPLHFYVITDQKEKDLIYESYNRNWLKEAPVILVICGNHSKSWKRKDGKDHCDIDAAIAIDHMTLAAADLGLGTCWICAFDPQRCHELMRLPQELEVIALLPLGYPRVERNSEFRRKSMEELTTWGMGSNC